jgi:hypothetical protein
LIIFQRVFQTFGPYKPGDIFAVLVDVVKIAFEEGRNRSRWLALSSRLTIANEADNS